VLHRKFKFFCSPFGLKFFYVKNDSMSGIFWVILGFLRIFSA
jgi:hypothetical protein